MPDSLVRVFQKPTVYCDSSNHVWGLKRMGQKEKEKIKWEASMWTKKPCYSQGSGGDEQTGSSCKEGNSSLNDPLWQIKKIQNTTTHLTMKQVGYSSRRPLWVPPLSAENRELINNSDSPKRNNKNWKIKTQCPLWGVSIHWTPEVSTVTRAPTDHLWCGETGDSHHRRLADKSAATSWCCHVIN